jgi:hypothetical protein
VLWPPSELKAELQRLGVSPSTDACEPEVLVATSSDQGDAPNATIAQVRTLLKAIPGRIDVLLDSAGRTGAQTALQTVLSWHPQVQLSRFYSIREGTTTLLERTYAEVNRLACTMVSWFSVYNYTPYLDEDGNPLPATSMAGLADSTLYSSVRPYDSPAPQPTRSESGCPPRDADLEDSGSSVSSPKSTRGGTSSTAGQTEPSSSVGPTTTSVPPTAPTAPSS